MALSASKVSNCAFLNQRTATSFAKSIPQNRLHHSSQQIDLTRLSSMTTRLAFSGEHLLGIHRQPVNLIISGRFSTVCSSTRTDQTEECTKSNGNISRVVKNLLTIDFPGSSTQTDEHHDEHPVMPGRIIHSSRGLAEACKFVYNDAKYVNERARNDIVLLSREIMRLNARARKDVAILGSQLFKLDARAREDTERIDRDVKEKAERLNHIARVLKNRAESRLKSVADKHWNDGALEADLRRADFRAKQRAMEDSLMALEFIKNIHDLMVSKMYKFPLRRKNGSATEMLGHIMLEKNGRTLDVFPGEVSRDRIAALQEAYWSMASALSEADGIDYTDPEELELLITTLIDLDAMDGKSSVSLLAECSSSPDVSTRQALAKALAAAPSMWTLGNAGMGALRRLAEDDNPAIAAAASKAIYELKKQWEIEEGDSWRFMMDQKPLDQLENNNTNEEEN